MLGHGHGICLVAGPSLRVGKKRKKRRERQTFRFDFLQAKQADDTRFFHSAPAPPPPEAAAAAFLDELEPCPDPADPADLALVAVTAEPGASPGGGDSEDGDGPGARVR